jgi:hypothetical protein
MPQEIRELELINGHTIKVRFVWLFGDEPEPSYYPQAVRAWSEQLAERLRPQYEAMERTYAGGLAANIPVSQAILSPPSRYPFAATYRDACLTNRPEILDISARFQKPLGSRNAGEEGTTAEDTYRSLSYAASGDESGITSITMVDDVVADGKTTTAIFSHLVEAGMQPDAEITVASLLRIRPRRRLQLQL